MIEYGVDYDDFNVKIFENATEEIIQNSNFDFLSNCELFPLVPLIIAMYPASVCLSAYLSFGKPNGSNTN